jgi:hypothetical protein
MMWVSEKIARKILQKFRAENSSPRSQRQNFGAGPRR